MTTDLETLPASIGNKIQAAEYAIEEGDIHAAICSLIYAAKAARRAGLDDVAGEIDARIDGWEQVAACES